MQKQRQLNLPGFTADVAKLSSPERIAGVVADLIGKGTVLLDEETRVISLRPDLTRQEVMRLNMPEQLLVLTLTESGPVKLPR